jgi:hypothetical protein
MCRVFEQGTKYVQAGDGGVLYATCLAEMHIQDTSHNHLSNDAVVSTE